MSIVKALRIIGLPPERFESKDSDVWRRNARRVSGKKYGHTTFWERNEHCLQEIANEMRQCFRRRIQQIHPDRSGDEEAAKVLIGAYLKAKDMFRRYGVEV